MTGGGPEVRVFPSPAALAEAAADLFVETAAGAVRERGTFRVALAGGTSPVGMHRRLAEPPRRDAVDWSRVSVFFGDERCLPAGDAGRNDQAASETFLSRVPIPAANVFPVETGEPDAAARYESAIRGAFDAPGYEVPRFDLIVLGLGPDGHMASLFPGHPGAGETKQLVIRITGSPKPPPDRVTFTLPLLNAARLVVFLADGAAKAAVVARAVHGDESLPSGRVHPSSGRLVWLVDAEAATGMSPS